MPNFSFQGCLEVEVWWLENNKNKLGLEASLAPAEAEVGAVAKVDQKKKEDTKFCLQHPGAAHTLHLDQFKSR